MTLRRRATRVVLAAVPIVVVASASRLARGAGHVFDDPYDVPYAPRPPTLPELTHAELEATLETTAGAILPNPGGDRTHAYVQRLALEVPVSLRRWYVGFDYELAAGGAGGSFPAVGGNAQLVGRTLWATPTGLAFGGGVALVLPTAHFDTSGPAQTVAIRAAGLRPWDESFFVDGAYGVRPFMDVRAVDGAYVVQFREGLDVLGLTSGGRGILYAVTGAYVGWRVRRAVAFGLEAFEAYAIDVPGSVTDGQRATVVISPNVRLALPWVQPAISLFTTVGTPLQGASDHVWGFRFAFTLVYDPSSTLGLRPQ